MPRRVGRARRGWISPHPPSTLSRDRSVGERRGIHLMREFHAMTTVRAALIQAHANMGKQEAIDKHVGMIERRRRPGRADRLPPGDLLRPLLLRRRGQHRVVPHGRERRDRPDGQAHDGAREEARHRARGADLRRGDAGRVLQHHRRDRRRRHATSASTARRTSRRSRRSSGRSTSSSPATSATPCSTRRSARSAWSSATTATSPRSGASSASTARRSCSTRARRSRACRATCGSSSRPRAPRRTATGWARSTASASESPISEHKFYGSSYFADPKGQIVAQANDTDDAIVIADIDLDEIQRTRDTWQFFRDRRPETYAATVNPALP